MRASRSQPYFLAIYFAIVKGIMPRGHLFKKNYIKINKISIFGGHDIEPNSDLFREVAQVAKILAQNDYTIVNGGGPGVMMAATQGAEAAGGKTLAVTFNPKSAPGFEGRYIQNSADEEIKTSNYIERMYALMEHGQCYIIFRGGTGTISEFGTAWCLARLYYGHHKPLILYGKFWHDIVAVFYRNMILRENDERVYRIVDSIEGVLGAIEIFDKEMASLDHTHCKVCKEKAFMR